MSGPSDDLQSLVEGAVHGAAEGVLTAQASNVSQEAMESASEAAIVAEGAADAATTGIQASEDALRASATALGTSETALVVAADAQQTAEETFAVNQEMWTDLQDLISNTHKSVEDRLAALEHPPEPEPVITEVTVDDEHRTASPSRSASRRHRFGTSKQ